MTLEIGFIRKISLYLHIFSARILGSDCGVEWQSWDFQCTSVLSCVQFFATPWTVARQASLSWNFPGKNTGVGCHCLLQVIFPTQGLNPHLPCLLHWQVDSLPLCHMETYDTWVQTVTQGTLLSIAGGSTPSQGAKIPYALWPKKERHKQKQYWNNFNKDFKNGLHQNIF